MMEKILEKTADMLSIDRNNWELVRFGDVAIQQKGTVDRDKSELTKYVKGEHMGSQDLHLREWGELEDEYLGPAFIRKFNKGDILYGSRRTYLRKVVIAPFEGITSNTTFVIKANEKKIDKRLLPFVMMSEGFTENSIKNSKGSVNPYINWKDISNYEFLLPPKDQQAKLAELLWAMDEVIEMANQLLNEVYITKRTVRKILFEGESFEKKENKIGNLESKWQFVKLGNCSTIKGRIGWRGLKQSEYVQAGPYLIAGKHINEGKIDWEQCDMITNQRYDESMEIALKKGDVIFSKDGAIGNPALIYELPNKATLNSTMMMLRPKSNLDSEYLYQILISVYFDRLKYRCLSGSAIPHIFQGDMKNFEFPLPPFEEQQRIGKILKQFDQNIDKIKLKVFSSKSLQKSIINQIF